MTPEGMFFGKDDILDLAALLRVASAQTKRQHDLNHQWDRARMLALSARLLSAAERLESSLAQIDTDSTDLDVPIRHQRCCVIHPNGARCCCQATHWVGSDPTDDYTHVCEEHIAAVKRENDMVVSQKHGWPKETTVPPRKPQSKGMVITVNEARAAAGLSLLNSGFFMSGGVLTVTPLCPTTERKFASRVSLDEDVVGTGECPQGHHQKDGPCMDDYCSCPCQYCRQQCEER